MCLPEGEGLVLSEVERERKGYKEGRVSMGALIPPPPRDALTRLE